MAGKGAVQSSGRDGATVGGGGDEVGGLSAESNSLREVVGTVFYRSPEQEGEGLMYDEKADMWALGVIFFELLLALQLRHGARSRPV